MPSRVILHVDLDAFFPSVEARENPELKGKPIVVGADPKQGKGRGVVSSASYEARKYGIRSAMPISTAWRLCPQAVYLSVNYPLYTRLSAGVMALLRGYADRFEQAGIDEAFLDVTSRVQGFEDAAELAKRVQQELLEKEGLTCSIGVASNKLVAKIASDFQKPSGLTVVRPDAVKAFLSPLPVRKLWGVGPKTEQALRTLGIRTVGELASSGPAVLEKAFGTWGLKLQQLANGVDESPVEERGEVKSVSRETTFQEDTDDREVILRTLDELALQVHRDLEASGLGYRTVSIKLRYENFETHTHAESLPFPTDKPEPLREKARTLIDKSLREGRKVRLVGVRASGLVSGHKQKTLDETARHV